jgi:hypothetical protein
LNAFVDAAKDDFVSKLNANPHTMGMISFLLRSAGLNPKTIALFVTNPIIREYINNRDIY